MATLYKQKLHWVRIRIHTKWSAEKTDEQIQREKAKLLKRKEKKKRAIERDKNRQEGRHSGKSKEDKGTGYQMGKNGTQELRWAPWKDSDDSK